MRKIVKAAILLYLRFWARIAVRQTDATIIGIAGSAGKSSTRNAVTAILKDAGPTIMVSGNSETGLALGLVGIQPKGYGARDWFFMMLSAPFGTSYLRAAKYVVVEMGIDGPLPPHNMGYLLTVVKPHIGICLNISATHTENFEKVLTKEDWTLPAEQRLEVILRRMAEEDTKMIRKSGCRIGIYNADDPFIRSWMDAFAKNETATHLLSFGEGEGEGNAASVVSYDTDLKGSQCTIRFDGEPVSLAFPGMVLPKVYGDVFAAAMLVGRSLGVPLQRMKQSLEKNYSLPKGRSGLLPGINGSTIIDSSYNACRSASVPFFELLETLHTKQASPVVIIFGDIRELGETAQGELEAVARTLPRCTNALYCIGPLTKQFMLPVVEQRRASELPKLRDVQWFPTYRKLGEYAREHIPEQAIVLVKGSQNQLFLEEAIKYILRNPEDSKKLCRQEPYWTKIKQLK